MGIVARSLRNVLRSPLRTGAVMAVLAVSVGLALVMLTVNAASQGQLQSIRGEIGTDITVRPAGQFAMMGGGEPLNGELVDQLGSLDHVVSVQKTAQTQYTGGNLESAVLAGTLGRRFQGSGQPGFTSSPPISVTGFDPTIEEPVLMGGGTVSIVDGRYFTRDEADADLMVVGQALAEKNGLGVSSQVDIEGAPVEVIGIFSSGQRFGDNMLLMPISTVQRLFDLEGVTSVTVVADDVDNVDGVVEAIRAVFDEDTADIVTSASTYERISGPLANASKTSQMGMLAALTVAAVVILFSAVLTVRQRVKEIGILKAIGASNWHVGLQFSVEALAISVPAAIVGALATFPLAQRVAGMIMASSANAAPGVMPGGMGGRGGMFGGGGITTIGGIEIAVSPEVFLYALGIALALALVASIFPAWYISRLKPAEVLRYE